MTSGLVLADPIYERPMNTVVAGFMASLTMTFLRATISPGPGSMVDGGDGTVWPLQPDKSPGLARAIRRPSACGPQHFHLMGDRRAERRGGRSGHVTVKVTIVEPTGPECLPVARLAGQEVTIACKPGDTPPIDAECGRAIDMTKACLFNPTSGSCL